MNAARDIRTETVRYEAAGTPLEGFLAVDAAREGKRPAVIVVHEWWGLNDYVKRRARMLAERGYLAFAVDMYGEGRRATTPDEAGAAMNALMGDRAALEARFRAGLDQVRAQPQCDGRAAAIGYCMGGAIVLHMARIGTDLTAVASFHGILSPMEKAKPGTVKARVLVCHGSEDAMVPEDQVRAFKEEMHEAGVDYRFVAYAGARHGFTNPAADDNGRKYGLPLAYDAGADERSWTELERFLEESFAG